jgi:(p)ppGpp synthase/HD superfamily hydrolase
MMPDLPLEELLKSLSTIDRECVEAAITVATEAHDGQYRKGPGKVPYVEHCKEVLRLLLAVGNRDVATLQAAVLHDVIEDTHLTYTDLLVRFGPPVANLVDEVSDDRNLPSPMRKWQQVHTAHRKSLPAALIKIANKTHNVCDIVHRPPEGWSWERRAGYVGWAAAVVSRMPMPGNPEDFYQSEYLRLRFKAAADDFWSKPPL